MDTIVRTRAGMVSGAVEGGAHVFRGVPFAAPPVGRNRFRAPQAVEPWRGVREAHNFGARPLQPETPAAMQAMVPGSRSSGLGKSST